MNRRDAEAQRLNSISQKVISAAIEVHKALGPGLLESAYDDCLCHELLLREIDFRRQVELPVIYKGIRVEAGYRMDILIGQCVIVELKAVAQLLPVHHAQLLTYLKLTDLHLGLLINFNIPAVRNGIKRVVYKFPDPSAPQRLCGEKAR